MHVRINIDRHAIRPPGLFWRWIYSRPGQCRLGYEPPAAHSAVLADVPLPDHHPSRYQRRIMAASHDEHCDEPAQ